jgi:ABC-type cobalamin transport system ATPase subunit
MTSAADGYQETVILLEQAPSGVVELAQRAQAHERIRLVAADGGAVVVMSEADLDQALQDASDLAEARAILANPDPDPLSGAAALSWLDEVVAGG